VLVGASDMAEFLVKVNAILQLLLVLMMVLYITLHSRGRLSSGAVHSMLEGVALSELLQILALDAQGISRAFTPHESSRSLVGLNLLEKFFAEFMESDQVA